LEINHSLKTNFHPLSSYFILFCGFEVKPGEAQCNLVKFIEHSPSLILAGPSGTEPLSSAADGILAPQNAIQKAGLHATDCHTKELLEDQLVGNLQYCSFY
jgi:hypothetical protein